LMHILRIQNILLPRERNPSLVEKSMNQTSLNYFAACFFLEMLLGC